MRARLLRAEQPLTDDAWSSFPSHLLPPAKRPGWLRVDRLLGEFGVQRDDAAGRRRFGEAMEVLRGRDEPGEWNAIRRGWFPGGATLKARLLEQMEAGVGQHQRWDAKEETDEQKAERIVADELPKRRWVDRDLQERRKTDSGKV